MPSCGSQCILCDVPIRFDVYQGCSHGCKYCFVQRKNTLDFIRNGESAKSLARFIAGERTKQTAWCDWNIPLHVGGMSDPFQPIEQERKKMLQCLKILAKTQYPFIVSTKGELIIKEPWLNYLSDCNAVVQISMACESYDILEPGAPTYLKRLEMIRILAPKVKRVIVRVQPYLHECFAEIKSNIARVADAGAYGIIFEGMKFLRKKNGLVKVGGDYCYPVELLKNDFLKLKEEARRNNLKFYSGENRLRSMGDSLTCCGVDDLPGFKVNTFNINHLVNSKDIPVPTEKQQTKGTATCFQAIGQCTEKNLYLKKVSFEDEMINMLKNNKQKMLELFGK